MDVAAQELHVRTRRVVGLQVGIVALAAWVFFFMQGLWGAVSAAYGGVIGIVSAVLLSLGVARAGVAAQRGSKAGEAILYGGAAIRFILVLLLFALGLAVFGLVPLATVAGFIAVQLAFLLAAKGPRGVKHGGRDNND